jgi:hypothetical protein
MKTQMKMMSILFVSCALAFSPSVFAQADATRHLLVGTWEKVSSKAGDSNEFKEVPKDKRIIKMFTPTNFIVIEIDPATRKITSAHGGPCLLGNGEFTEWVQYATTPWADVVKFTSKVRFEGDKIIQSSEYQGNRFEEIWRLAKAADVPTAAPRVGKEKEITLTGDAICAKCALKQAQSCQLALQVDAGGYSIVYFLQPDEVRKRLEKQIEEQRINWCATPTKVVATGVVRQIDGRPVLVSSRLEQAPKQ